MESDIFHGGGKCLKKALIGKRKVPFEGKWSRVIHTFHHLDGWKTRLEDYV